MCVEGALGIAQGVKGKDCTPGEALEGDAGPVVDGGDQDAIVLLLRRGVLVRGLLEGVGVLVLVLVVCVSVWVVSVLVEGSSGVGR